MGDSALQVILETTDENIGSQFFSCTDLGSIGELTALELLALYKSTLIDNVFTQFVVLSFVQQITKVQEETCMNISAIFLLLILRS